MPPLETRIRSDRQGISISRDVGSPRPFCLQDRELDKLPPNRRDEIRDRIISGHIRKTVWWLAWPSVITMLLQSANGLIDVAFVGRLGAEALSGVGLAGQVMMILMALITGVSVGTTALVSRFVGANDAGSAEEVVRQSMLLSVVVAALSGGLIYFTGPILISAMGGAGESLELGVVYLNILLVTVLPFYLMFILTGVFRGVGEMRTPMIIMAVVTVWTVTWDYLLIFGIGPFPRLEVVGAGIATGSSRVVAMLLFLYFLPRTSVGGAFRGSWRPSLSWFRRILNIGTPASLQGLLRTGGSMTYFAILGLTPEATYAIAALTIGLRMESLAFMPGFAFSVAATSMVGQNLGARKPDRAAQGASVAAWQGVGIMGVVGLIFVIFAHPIASIFTDDPIVLPLAAAFLRINGIVEPFLGLGMVLTGALHGAGETRVPTAITISTMWLIRLPLTYYLAISIGMGAVGAWIAMAGSTTLSGLLTLAAFRRSNWQEKNI